jgi:hypothetical protein
VNHIDGNPRNNEYTNLEWISDRDNQLHGVGLETRKNKKPVQQFLLEVDHFKLLAEYRTLAEAELYTTIRQDTIGMQLLNGKTIDYLDGIEVVYCKGFYWRRHDVTTLKFYVPEDEVKFKPIEEVRYKVTNGDELIGIFTFEDAKKRFSITERSIITRTLTPGHERFGHKIAKYTWVMCDEYGDEIKYEDKPKSPSTAKIGIKNRPVQQINLFSKEVINSFSCTTEAAAFLAQDILQKKLKEDFKREEYITIEFPKKPREEIKFKIKDEVLPGCPHEVIAHVKYLIAKIQKQINKCCNGTSKSAYGFGWSKDF